MIGLAKLRHNPHSISSATPTNKATPAPSNKNQPAPSNKNPANKNAPHPAPQQSGGGSSSSSKLPTLAPKPSQPAPKCVTFSVLVFRSVPDLMPVTHYSPAKGFKFAEYVFVRFLMTPVLTFPCYFKTEQTAWEEEPRFHSRQLPQAEVTLGVYAPFSTRTLLSLA